MLGRYITRACAARISRAANRWVEAGFIDSNPFGKHEVYLALPELPRPIGAEARDPSGGNQSVDRAGLDLEILAHALHGHDIGVGHRLPYVAIRSAEAHTENTTKSANTKNQSKAEQAVQAEVERAIRCEPIR